MARLVHWICYRKHYLAGVVADDQNEVWLPADIPGTEVTVTYLTSTNSITDARAFVMEPRRWYRLYLNWIRD